MKKKFDTAGSDVPENCQPGNLIIDAYFRSVRRIPPRLLIIFRIFFLSRSGAHIFSVMSEAMTAIAVPIRISRKSNWGTASCEHLHLGVVREEVI